MLKHFLKTLVIFISMIILGLLGVFLVSHFGAEKTISNSNTESIEDIAK